VAVIVSDTLNAVAQRAWATKKQAFLTVFADASTVYVFPPVSATLEMVVPDVSQLMKTKMSSPTLTAVSTVQTTVDEDEKNASLPTTTGVPIAIG
jgi:malonyl CoA-acyl carrier protein transacylase